MKLREANIEESNEVFAILKDNICQKFKKNSVSKDEDQARVEAITQGFIDVILFSRAGEGEITKLNIETIRDERNVTLMQYAINIKSLVAIRSLLRFGVGVDFDHSDFLLKNKIIDQTFMEKLKFHSNKTEEITKLFNKDPGSNSWVEKIEEILNIIERNDTNPEIKKMSKELLSDVIKSIDPMELYKSETAPDFDQEKSKAFVLNFLEKNKTTPRINSLKKRIDSIFTDHSSEVEQEVNTEFENSIKGYIERKEVEKLKDIFDYLCNNQELVAEKNLHINWEKIFESAASEYDPEIFTCCIDGRIKFEKVLYFIGKAEYEAENLKKILSENTNLPDLVIEQYYTHIRLHLKNEDLVSEDLVSEDLVSLYGEPKVLKRSDIIDQYKLLPQIEKLHGKEAVKNLLSYLEIPNPSLSSARTKRGQDNSNSNELFFKRG